MQKLINEYFDKLCSDKFFKDDYEEIIGRKKDVIEKLKENVQYAKNPKNNVDKSDIKFIKSETKALLKQIKNENLKDDDVIYLDYHPMSDFYALQSTETLYNELKDYMEDLEDDENEN